jgi:hypothetical protein
MNFVPEVPWRPARWLTTNFVQPDNPAVKEEAAKLKSISQTDDEYVLACAEFIRDSFIYPLDYLKEPSAGMVLRRYDKGRWWKYYFNKTMDYSWGFPCETLVIGKGICIDTALLMTSLLMAGGIYAKTALGAVVNSKTDEVAGYHAWTEMIYKGVGSTCETTIHSKDTDTILQIASTYNRNSDWATSNGIYYKLEARFDDKLYEPAGLLGTEMVSLMGMTPQRVECFGMVDTLARLYEKRKALSREWRKSAIITYKILSQAYGGG